MELVYSETRDWHGRCRSNSKENSVTLPYGHTSERSVVWTRPWSYVVVLGNILRTIEHSQSYMVASRVSAVHMSTGGQGFLPSPSPGGIRSLKSLKLHLASDLAKTGSTCGVCPFLESYGGHILRRVRFCGVLAGEEPMSGPGTVDDCI